MFDFNEEKMVIPVKKHQGESTVVTARLPSELVKCLDAIAKETGRTRNEIMLLSLEFALDHLEIKE